MKFLGQTTSVDLLAIKNFVKNDLITVYSFKSNLFGDCYYYYNLLIRLLKFMLCVKCKIYVQIIKLYNHFRWVC